jgi:toxin ParE1/3/4
VRSARFHAEAEFELQAEATYYEQHTKGLGERFAREVEAAVRVACSFPFIGSPYKYGTRRVYPKKFPFSVVYLVRSEEILVLAIAPFAKKPGYWRNRRGVV